MPYLVRLADRALRDMETIYEFIEAGASERAAAWFNSLAEEIHSLERFPERGAIIPESKKFRHLLFGKKPSTYRIIYAVDKRNGVVNVLHIRHGARAALSRKEKKTAVALLPFSVCFAPGIPSSRAPEHLRFACEL